MIKHAMINYCRVRKRSAHAPSILLLNQINIVIVLRAREQGTGNREQLFNQV